MVKSKTSGVYKITNLLNNKIYIGSSYCIPRRWREHKLDIFRNNKGIMPLEEVKELKNLKFEIIEHGTGENLLEREKYYIQLYKSYDRTIGYNKRIDPTNINPLSAVEKERTLLVLPKTLKQQLEKEVAKDNRSFNNYVVTILENRPKKED